MSKKTIAIVGASGHLGKLIAAALLENPGISVRLLVRPQSRAKVAAIEKRGADIVEGVLGQHDTAALTRLTDGAFATISAIQGGPDEIVGGQTELASGGQQNFLQFLPLMYYRSTLNGEGRLDPLYNDMFPDIHPTTVREYVAQEGL